MAGIGFQLRKIVKYKTYFNMMRAYSYAGMLSSGPWVISVIGIVILDLLRQHHPGIASPMSQFQVSITYLIASSLIFSGFMQHSFTRYISDQLFLLRDDRVVPNYVGILLLTTGISGLAAFAVVPFLFPQQTAIYQLLFAGSFVILCNIWLTTNLLSGIKAYQSVLLVFLAGYGVTVLLGYQLYRVGLLGLMLSFFVGQFVLLAGAIVIVFRSYPSDRLIEYDFLRPRKIHCSLVFASLFYNAAIWADKFLFWFNPNTSHAVLGFMRASVIYDMPMFLAILTMIPGMAVFLFRMETDFAEYYSRYFDAIRDGGTLLEIREKHVQLINSARQGVFDIAKVQALVILMVFIIGPDIMAKLGISMTYLYLFKIDVISASLLVLFLGMQNILFYLDRRHQALLVNILFFILNISFTMLSFRLGAFFYGYGFAASLFVTVLATMFLLDFDFAYLEYETFMRA